MSTVSVSEKNFGKEVLQHTTPVLVDFWAPWCGPCKMIAPLIDELATEFQGRLKVVKINVDDAPQVASQYGIMSIPTLAFFRGGKVVDQVVGALAKPALKRKIEETLG